MPSIDCTFNKTQDGQDLSLENINCFLDKTFIFYETFANTFNSVLLTACVKGKNWDKSQISEIRKRGETWYANNN